MTSSGAVARYAAFLRGVSPINAKMAELKRAFEAAGFEDVKTVLSSGNVVFGAPTASESSLQHEAEAAMMAHLGRTFLTIVRPIDALREMLASDPYKRFRLKPETKRIVTFLQDGRGQSPNCRSSSKARASLRSGARKSSAHTPQVPGERFS
jgi:uncharacterized protein (DUF1697 family)